MSSNQSDQEHQYKSYPFLDRLENRLVVFEVWICSISLMIMTLSVLISVVVRAASIRLPNVAELALVCMIPIAFCGAALCYAKGMHIAVDILAMIRNKIFNYFLNLVVALLCLLFCVLVSFHGITFLGEFIDSGEIMMDMGTPIAIPAFFLPFGMILFTIHVVISLIRMVAEHPFRATGGVGK